MDETANNYFFEGHLNDEAVALYAEAINSDDFDSIPEILLLHVEDCLICKKKIITISQIISKDIIDNKDLQIDENEKKIRQLPLLKIIKVAAVILVIGIGGLAYYSLKTSKKSNISEGPSLANDTILVATQAKNDPILTKTRPEDVDINTKNSSAPNNKLASNMEESELFESLIASSLRSGEIKIIAPLMNQHYTEQDTIHFEFKKSATSALKIKIYNNKGEKVYEKENITVDKCKINAKLSPGLYYWKLEKKDDLIHIGKFVIDR